MGLQRTSNGKILRVSGGLARECCCSTPCECTLSGEGVENISRSQFLAYQSGGTLDIKVSFIYDESWDGPPDVSAAYTGFAVGSASQSYEDSCGASVYVVATGPISVSSPKTDPPVNLPDLELSYTLSFQLCYDGTNYQIKWSLSGSLIAEGGTSSYPVLDISLPQSGTGGAGPDWYPAGTVNAGYYNNSTLTINASLSAAP